MEMELEDGTKIPFVYYHPQLDTHRIPLGTLVEVKDLGLRLYVVEHRNDPYGNHLYNLSHSKTYIDLLGNISTMFTDEVMDSPLLKKQMDDSLKLIRAVFLEGVKEEDLKLVWTDPIDPTLTITTDPK